MNLKIAVNRIDHKVIYPSFWGDSKSKNKDNKYKLPKIGVKTPKKLHPVDLPGVSFDLGTKIVDSSNKLGISTDDYLKLYLKHLTYEPKVIPEKSKSATVGQTKVTTLIDGEQIFNKVVEDLKSAEESILVEMFEFQNLKVDAHKWPTNGADVVPGFEQQQSILPILLSKKKENPNLKIQVILDAHKWYINGHGQKDRHYNNQDMIKFLKQKGIDVVPYPRPAQGGAALQHVKLVAVDGKKVVIGGMNWGSHSCANHDACIAIETLPQYDNSEVDNIIEEVFNKDWKFAWQRLGKTKLIAGPLNEEEQEFYKGLRKEIKLENVIYKSIVADLFDNPEDLERYERGDLNLTDVSTLNDPKIKVLATKPRELVYADEEGKETTRKYLHQRLQTADKVRAELFVLSDKELIETIIKRHKAGTLDAKFIVSSDILRSFPYCRKAYDKLLQNNVPVRLYNFDETINQRMHAKWAVFIDEGEGQSEDKKELVIGSTNWSAMGLNQNLKKGMREDYELYTKKINKEIRGYLKDVEEFEEELGLPPLSRKKFEYSELLVRRKKFKKALGQIKDTGLAEIELQGKEYSFTQKDKANLLTIQGYYKIIKDRYNAKEKYKRGNNECAVALTNNKISNVFLRQFDKDWKHSVSDYNKLREKVLKMKPVEGISRRIPEENASVGTFMDVKV